jgi:hypothetical protein
MSDSKSIDFQAIKSQVSILQILEHYGLMSRLSQTGEFITGKCPVHESNRNIAFRANTTINCWNCFNQCGCSGDIIDFVRRKERVSAQKAAHLIISWFKLSFDTPVTEAEEATVETDVSPALTNEPAHLLADSPAFSGATMFAVKRYWEMSDTVYVPATTVDAAILAAHNLPLNIAKAEYVPDSMNSDRESDVHPLPQ